MWVFTVYILDPTLQQDCKLPKWQPWSCCGIFVVSSTNNSSDVTVTLNPATGHIYPQFSLIFDDSFSTLRSIYTKEIPPSFWNKFYLDNFIYSVTLNDDAYTPLNTEWLTTSKLEDRERMWVNTYKISL